MDAGERSDSRMRETMKPAVPTTYSTPTLFLSDAQIRLLGNAEMAVAEECCTRGCVHHVPFAPCASCVAFAPSAAGYVSCDGYRQSDAYLGVS